MNQKTVRPRPLGYSVETRRQRCLGMPLLGMMKISLLLSARRELPTPNFTSALPTKTLLGGVERRHAEEAVLLRLKVLKPELILGIQCHHSYLLENLSDIQEAQSSWTGPQECVLATASLNSGLEHGRLTSFGSHGKSPLRRSCCHCRQGAERTTIHGKSFATPTTKGVQLCHRPQQHLGRRFCGTLSPCTNETVRNRRSCRCDAAGFLYTLTYSMIRRMQRRLSLAQGYPRRNARDDSLVAAEPAG